MTNSPFERRSQCESISNFSLNEVLAEDLHQNPSVEAAETGVDPTTGRSLWTGVDLTTGRNLRTGVDLTTGRILQTRLIEENLVSRRSSIFWDPPPSFSLVEQEPVPGLFAQVGSPRTNSASGVESQRSALHTEVEDSSLDVPSGRMVSGERSQDTHSSRKEVLNPEEELPSNGVTRERSQDTHSSCKEVLDPAEELSSNGVTRERSQVTHSSRKEVLDPTEALSSNGTVTRERS